jgi:hypothetical protein
MKAQRTKERSCSIVANAAMQQSLQVGLTFYRARTIILDDRRGAVADRGGDGRVVALVGRY